MTLRLVQHDAETPLQRGRRLLDDLIAALQVARLPCVSLDGCSAAVYLAIEERAAAERWLRLYGAADRWLSVVVPATAGVASVGISARLEAQPRPRTEP